MLVGFTGGIQIAIDREKVDTAALMKSHYECASDEYLDKEKY